MLNEAQAFVEGFGGRNGLTECNVLRLQLIIEELFTNTVTHGYGRECDEPVEITLAAQGGRVTLFYEDAARPYDPLATLPTSQSRLAAPVEQRPVGQLGLLLVAGLVDDARYTREDGRNRLQLLLKATGLVPG